MALFVLAIILIAYFIQRWYAKNALQGVSYRFDVTRVLTAPDESFEMVTTLTNHTRRFIPYVKMTETLPAGIHFFGGATVLDAGFYSNEPQQVSKFYLYPRGRLERRTEVSLPKRGQYRFQKAWLWGGDFLGLSENCERMYRNAEVVVYPHPAEGAYLEKVMGGFMGDVSVRRFIIDDPVLTIGFREYTGREPFKDISWLQSAKTGQMMVKTRDYTTDISVSVVLNVEMLKENQNPEAVEACYSIAHTVCRQLENQKIKYDFFANFSTFGAEYSTWKYLPEGLGSRHLRKILEGLGRASHNAVEPFEDLLHRALIKQTGAKSILIITPGPEAQARQLLAGRDENRAVIISGEQVPQEEA